jgi:hypothetical protein
MMKTPPGICVAGLSFSLLLTGSLLISASSSTGHHLGHVADRKSATLTLDSLDGLEIHAVQEKGLDPVKVTYDVTTYRGRGALHLLNDDSVITKGNQSGGQSLAIVTGSDFKDGSIEVDLVGLPRKSSPPDTRGFVGLAFHVRDNGDHFEAFYLRFTNGRAGDQLRRNHTAQYVSESDFPWFRLRNENPGLYESYVDIEPGAWTNFRVEVTGTKARLYVNHAVQACLIVNDLKLGEVHGQVALWDGSDTEAYFSNLRIDRR